MGLKQSTIIYRDHPCQHYWLCPYLPLSAGKDTLSRSLVKFKQGRQPDLSGWIDCSLELLEDRIAPGSTIVRALHHEEISVSKDQPAALDQLGAALAIRFHCRYQPSLLRKSRPARKISTLHKEEREAELKDIYYIEGFPRPVTEGSPRLQIEGSPQSHILVIDDILTTGATAKTIFDAFLTHFPGVPLTLFTLARAGYDADPDHDTPLKGRNYQLEQGMDWVMAQEEEADFCYSAQQLRTWIMTDTF